MRLCIRYILTSTFRTRQGCGPVAQQAEPSVAHTGPNIYCKTNLQIIWKGNCVRVWKQSRQKIPDAKIPNAKEQNHTGYLHRNWSQKIQKSHNEKRVLNQMRYLEPLVSWISWKSEKTFDVRIQLQKQQLDLVTICNNAGKKKMATWKEEEQMSCFEASIWTIGYWRIKNYAVLVHFWRIVCYVM